MSAGSIASRHRVERRRRVERIDERLRGKRAHAACRVRAQRADGEEAARDGDAEGAVESSATIDQVMRPGLSGVVPMRAALARGSPT